ncbi:hypothetical protein HXX76_000385 [Chlamydomonas incerta]|uniref:Uncharacterized protein n=1 Tax=Chlamydomonas incerta TaxID=51695 RepID=A0A835WE89_CHLIN|nr:hypothetical protein HXX76_000385 [Chlamydomonas incerta]|eukprot:KAG2445781.1 hypothetical protein HXX76_000385 [Chlamydomonas incerta]
MIEDFRRREAGSKGLVDPEDEDGNEDEGEDKHDQQGDSGSDADDADADDGKEGEFQSVQRSAMSFTARMEVPPSRLGERCGTPAGTSSWRQLPGPGAREGSARGGGAQSGLFDEDVVGAARASSGRLDGSSGSFVSMGVGGPAAGGSSRACTPARPMSAARPRPAGTALSPTPRDSVNGASAASSCSGAAGGSASGGSVSGGGGAGAGTRNPALMLKMIEAAANSQAARRRGAAPGVAAAVGGPAGPRESQRSCPNLYIPMSLLDEPADTPAANGGATHRGGPGGALPTPTSPGAIGAAGAPAAPTASVPSSGSGSGLQQRAMTPGRAPSRLGLNIAGTAEEAGAPARGGTLNGYGSGGGGGGTSFVIPQQQPKAQSANNNAPCMGALTSLASGSGEATFLTDGDDGAAALSPVRRLRSIAAASPCAGAGSGGLSGLMGGLGSGGGSGVSGGVSGGSGGSRPVTPGTGALINAAEGWRTRQLSPGGRLLHAQATRSPSRRSVDVPHTTSAGPLSPVGMGGRITRGSASFDQGSRPGTPLGMPGGPAPTSLTTGRGGGGAAADSPFNSRIAPAAAAAEAGAAAGGAEPAWSGTVSSRSFTSMKNGVASPLFGRCSSPAAPFSGSSSMRAGLLQPLVTTDGSGGGLDPISEVVPESAATTLASHARVQPATPPTPSPAGRAAPLLVPHPPTAPPPQTSPGGAASPVGTSRRSLQARALLGSSPSGTFELRSDGSALQAAAAADAASGCSVYSAASDGMDVCGGGRAAADKAGSQELGPDTPCPTAGAHPSIMERLRGLFV